MRWLVATGVAVVAAAFGEASADPASPQVSPIRGAREDAQRLGEQLRDLDREPAPEPGPVPPSPADPRHGGDPRLADASACLERGAAAYRARDFTRAIGELVAASRLVPGWPDPYRWLALAEAEADDCPSALRNVAAFASRVAPGDGRLPELGALRDRCLHTGALRVDSVPGGALVRIDDGRLLATTAQRLTLPAGVHTVTVEKPGFEPRSQRVEVEPLGIRYTRFELTVAHDRPLARRWWAWTALGVAAVAVTVLAIDASHRTAPPQPPGSEPPPPSLPGVTCDAGGCHL
jgi:hypothetical protein